MNNYLPNFICVGAQKSATTTLADMLRKHSDIFVPEKKELHYFDDKNYLQNSLSKYKKFFSESNKYSIRADFTPIYLYLEEIPERIFNDIGSDVKILIMLRHPIDRAVSHYRMTFNKGYESLKFNQTFFIEKNRIKKNSFARSHFSYFDRGLYSSQVERYMSLFKNVKVVLFDEFITNNEETMNGIYDFIGVEKEKIELEKQNTGKGYKKIGINKFVYRISNCLGNVQLLKKNRGLKFIKRKILEINKKEIKLEVDINDEFYDELYNYYIGDIERLEILIRKDLSHWKLYKNKYLNSNNNLK